MKCSECDYSEKVLGCVPVFCTYGEQKYFLSDWTLENDDNPIWCPLRMENKKAKINKEDLVQWLMSKDEKVLYVAISYAENYLKYGVDVTEKAKIACENADLLERARRYGYMERVKHERENSEPDLHRGSE